MNFYREIPLKRLVAKVVENIPEADPHTVMEFIKKNSKTPYDSRSISLWTRRVENLMYI